MISLLKAVKLNFSHIGYFIVDLKTKQQANEVCEALGFIQL